MLCSHLVDTCMSAATALGYVFPVFEDRLPPEILQRASGLRSWTRVALVLSSEVSKFSD